MHLFLISLLLDAGQALLVPQPTGSYHVAVKHFELIDANRTDTLAPEPNTVRRFMVSAYLPISARYHCQNEVEPYMPALTSRVFDQLGVALGLPDGYLDPFEIQFCNISTIDRGIHVEKQHFPVAIHSPGLAGSRLLYGAMARSLASLGNIVFTMDHTYETQVVEFPDGSAAYAVDYGDSGNDTTLLRLLEPRTKDVSFLTSQLSNKTFTSSFFAGFPGTFDPHRIAVYGHSLGGSTAITTAQRDARVIGGLNFDGPVLGTDTELKKPFVFVASTRNETKDFPILPYWATLYPKIDASKMQLAVNNTQHYAFMDVPLLLTVNKAPSALQPAVDTVFGTLGGRRVEEAMNDMMTGLLKLSFYGQEYKLEHISRNRDVEVVRDDLRDCN